MSSDELSRRRPRGRPSAASSHWLGGAVRDLRLLFLILPTMRIVIGAFQSEGQLHPGQHQGPVHHIHPLGLLDLDQDLHRLRPARLPDRLFRRGRHRCSAACRAGSAAGMLTFSGVASNFAGVPLAFAFIATLGPVGLVTVFLRPSSASTSCPRLQHPVLPRSHGHLSLLPDPADGADHHACAGRPEA
jgi:putative spermidine/putrescine transport system permease protein